MVLELFIALRTPHKGFGMPCFGQWKVRSGQTSAPSQSFTSSYRNFPSATRKAGLSCSLSLGGPAMWRHMRRSHSPPMANHLQPKHEIKVTCCGIRASLFSEPQIIDLFCLHHCIHPYKSFSNITLWVDTHMHAHTHTHTHTSNSFRVLLHWHFPWSLTSRPKIEKKHSKPSVQIPEWQNG